MNKQHLRDHLRTSHTEAELQAWFDPLRLTLADGGNVEVGFPHAFFAQWFTKERQKHFEREVARVLGSHPRFVYEKAGFYSKAGRVPARTPLVPGMPKMPDYAQWSFETFIYNKKNEFPVSMAREISFAAENPPHTPFIITGKGVCGKTHLMRAMAGAMAKALPTAAIYVGTVEDLAALHAENEKPGVFKRKILRYKAVFIDNAQELSRHPDLQLELLYIVDTFREKKKPVVFAMDEDTMDPSTINPKLRARLEAGLAVSLKRPDLDIRIRYAKAQCAANRLLLKKDLLLPIAQRFHSLPPIQGMIAKITAYQKRNERPITHADLEKLLANETLSSQPATPSAIIAHVAEALSLSPEDISGNGRAGSIVLGRQIAMYLCRELLGASLSALGAYFGGKNHATVLYACKKIIKKMESDKDTHKLVTQIRNKFLADAF